MKRRAKGEGTIWQRSDGLWVAQITLPSGKRKAKYGKTQRIVRDWLLETQKTIKDGMMTQSGGMTVAALLDHYYDDVAIHTLRPKTLESYESIIRLHLKPEIGSVKLSALTPAHLHSMYSGKIKAGFSNRTVQYIHAVIHRALTQAVKWGLVVRNVADAVDAPKVKKIAPNILAQAQAMSLLGAANGRLKAILTVAMTCGMREGEILGLHWEDIDFKQSALYVRHTTQTIYKKGIQFSEPKTDKGKRAIDLPMITIEALKSYQQTTGDTSGLVFHTSTGKPYSARNLLREFQTLLTKLELPHVTFHSLRHFHATALLKANVNPKIVQERLGHTRIDMTLDTYSHVIPGMQKGAADEIDKLFEV